MPNPFADAPNDYMEMLYRLSNVLPGEWVDLDNGFEVRDVLMTEEEARSQPVGHLGFFRREWRETPAEPQFAEASER